MLLLDLIDATASENPEFLRKKIRSLVDVLGGADRLGAHPMSTFQKLQVTGCNLNGQTSAVRGASGYRLDDSIDLDQPPSLSVPVRSGTDATLTRERPSLPASLVVLHRLPKNLAKSEGKDRPYALAHLAGLSWLSKQDTTQFFDISSVFPGLLNNEKPEIGDLAQTTRLNAVSNEHCASDQGHVTQDLIDQLLALEIKGAVLAILDPSEADWFTAAKKKAEDEKKTKQENSDKKGKKKDDTKVPLELSYAKTLAGARKTDLLKFGNSESRDVDPDYTNLELEYGWQNVVAGSAHIAAAQKIKDGPFKDFAESTKKPIATQLSELHDALKKKRDALDGEKKSEPTKDSAASKNPDKTSEDKKAETYKKDLDKSLKALKELQKALDESHLYSGGNSLDAATVSPISKDHMEQALQTGVDIASWPFEAIAETQTSSTLLSMPDQDKPKLSEIVGQCVAYRFQVSGPGTLLKVQDTRAVFAQMTENAAEARGYQLAEKPKEKVKPEKNGDETDTNKADPNKRIVGALSYSSAIVLVEKAGEEGEHPLPGHSGVAFGVSVQTSRLIKYAAAAEKLLKSGSPDQETKVLEQEICQHLACDPSDLRKFFGKSVLSKMTSRQNADDGFDTDALILEATYQMSEAERKVLALNEVEAPISLFDHFGEDMRNQIKGGKIKPQSLRLRMMICSPFDPVAQSRFVPGVPPRNGITFAADLDFAALGDVTHFPTVELAAWFSPAFAKLAGTPEEMFEASVQPTTLFWQVLVS